MSSSPVRNSSSNWASDSAAERPQGVERLDLSEDDLCRSSLHRLTLSGRPLVSSFFLSGTGRPSPGAFKNREKATL